MCVYCILLLHVYVVVIICVVIHVYVYMFLLNFCVDVVMHMGVFEDSPTKTFFLHNILSGLKKLDMFFLLIKCEIPVIF